MADVLFQEPKGSGPSASLTNGMEGMEQKQLEQEVEKQEELEQEVEKQEKEVDEEIEEEEVGEEMEGGRGDLLNEGSLDVPVVAKGDVFSELSRTGDRAGVLYEVFLKDGSTLVPESTTTPVPYQTDLEYLQDNFEVWCVCLCVCVCVCVCVFVCVCMCFVLY